MVILHIATVRDNRANGVYVLVPKIIKAQQNLETVGLVNLGDYRPEGIENYFSYNPTFSLEQLAEPFNKPDIVVFHQVYSVEYIKISKELCKAKIPYIILPHGSLTAEAQKAKRMKKILGNILFRKFFKGAKGVQCLSEKECSNIKMKFPKFVASTGWNIPDKCKQTFNTEKIKFVYVGRLDYHIKGLDIMLNAFKLIMDSPYKDRCELSIYGPDLNGRFAHVEQMIAERSLNELVTLNPPVFDFEKENVLLDSDVFIQTSRTEALTLGILEALSYGLPCVVTPGTTWGDYINNYNAGWVTSSTPESVYEKIICAIDETALFDEKSKNAKRLVSENFSWEKSARDTISSYIRTIEHRGE